MCDAVDAIDEYRPSRFGHDGAKVLYEAKSSMILPVNCRLWTIMRAAKLWRSSLFTLFGF